MPDEPLAVINARKVLAELAKDPACYVSPVSARRRALRILKNHERRQQPKPVRQGPGGNGGFHIMHAKGVQS
jgi:hypothetical protein